jgi:hypothetical protein
MEAVWLPTLVEEEEKAKTRIEKLVGICPV